MKTLTTPQPLYSGPLGRHIARKEASQVEQLASLSATAIQYGPLATARQEASAQQQATLRAMRANIAGMMIEPLFNDAERLRCNDSIYQTECIAKLQTWFRNVYRVYKERETSLYMAFNDGTCAFLPVAA